MSTSQDEAVWTVSIDFAVLPWSRLRESQATGFQLWIPTLDLTLALLLTSSARSLLDHRHPVYRIIMGLATKSI
jgi:hypothetical protein